MDLHKFIKPYLDHSNIAFDQDFNDFFHQEMKISWYDVILAIKTTNAG